MCILPRTSIVTSNLHEDVYWLPYITYVSLPNCFRNQQTCTSGSPPLYIAQRTLFLIELHTFFAWDRQVEVLLLFSVVKNILFLVVTFNHRACPIFASFNYSLSWKSKGYSLNIRFGSWIYQIKYSSIRFKIFASKQSESKKGLFASI